MEDKKIIHAELLAIGDELLIGQTVNTNAAWMGARLNEAGIRVTRTTVTGDRADEIRAALGEAMGRAAIVLITGGLGPTRDDITKHTLCDFFRTELVMDEPSLARITQFFAERGRELLEINRQQALVPRDCVVIPNLRGTANGMWFEQGGNVVVSMPGVPYEMQAMMEEGVIPRLCSRFNLPAIIHRTVLTHGVGESFLAERIAGWEDSLAQEGISLAYLPSPGMVKLRMSIYGGGDAAALTARIARKEAELVTLLGDVVFGRDEDTLAGVIGTELLRREMTLSVAESCTGGHLAHMVTSVPGSSAYFLGGVVSYTHPVKESLLGVPPGWLAEHGAVNRETAIRMAEGVRRSLGSTWGLSTTGVAGPSGGTPEIPVGTVWIAVAGPAGTAAHEFRFGRSRERNILLASQAALDLLRKEIQAETV